MANKELLEDVSVADAAGLSYGVYVQRKELKNAMPIPHKTPVKNGRNYIDDLSRKKHTAKY